MNTFHATSEHNLRAAVISSAQKVLKAEEDWLARDKLLIVHARHDAHVELQRR